MAKWRYSREYRTWRAKVIRRDKKCKVCGSIQRRCAHHLNSAFYFENERFDVNNGICLCSNCHTQFHTNFKRSTRVKCTKHDFNNFMCLVEYARTLCKKAKEND